MPRTMKTLLNDTFVYFVQSKYSVSPQGSTLYIFLENTLLELMVDDDCSEFAIIFNKRFSEDHHMAWLRLSLDNYKEAKIYLDFLKQVVEETAEGGHNCDAMIKGMADRINPYVEKKRAKEKKNKKD